LISFNGIDAADDDEEDESSIRLVLESLLFPTTDDELFMAALSSNKDGLQSIGSVEFKLDDDEVLLGDAKMPTGDDVDEDDFE